MRRAGLATILALLLFMTMVSAAAAQQTGQINPRLPPPPPPSEAPAAAPAPRAVEITPLPLIREEEPVSVPDFVMIPRGTRIAVVLDTPLSTRITKKGDPVRFRTSDAVQLDDLLAIPPDTEISGTVLEAKRPGGFGKQGVMRVRVEEIKLSSGASAPIIARLDSQDTDKQGRISADSNRGADLYTLATWSAQGALLGAGIKGGKGAAIGAGAGAAIAMIILMSRRGPDLYLEPGMPFAVILDEQVELPGADVYTAQRSYAKQQASKAADSGNSSEVSRNPDNATLDKDRPALKRRPKKKP
jgi:hypothetical protein